MDSVDRITREVKRLSNKKTKAILERFFQTGPGQYAYGDIFLGVRVPQLRKLASRYSKLSYAECARLLSSQIHEVRLLSLLILIGRFRKGTLQERSRVYALYMRSLRSVNNWDLVDISAPHIVGAYLFDKSKAPLFRLSSSPSLWGRRIAIVSTFYFIKQNRYRETLRLARFLINDEHDLIHKAVGWMLREVGKRDTETLENFLIVHYRHMPRTMLRYAIEKFSPKKRHTYLKVTIR